MQKLTYLFLVAFFILALSVDIGYCQQEPKIEISDLLITRTGTNNFIKLGFSKHKVFEVFGKPKAIKKSYFIKFDFKGEMMEYNNTKFYFVDNALEAFEIRDSQFTIRTKSVQKPFIVGDKLDLIKLFNETGNSANINLQKNGEPWDEFLSIIIGSNKKIKYMVCGPD